MRVSIQEYKNSTIISTVRDIQNVGYLCYFNRNEREDDVHCYRSEIEIWTGKGQERVGSDSSLPRIIVIPLRDRYTRRK